MANAHACIGSAKRRTSKWKSRCRWNAPDRKKMNDTIKVLIVDDEELARRLLREYLGRHEDVAIVGESENGLEAVKDIARLNPDLVFMDIQMPKLNGLEVLELA